MDIELTQNLVDAVFQGRTDIVHTLLNAYESGAGGHNGQVKQLLANICTEDGTLLHLATKLSRVDIVRTLLSLGAKPDVRNCTGKTPYELACDWDTKAAYVTALMMCAAQSQIDQIQEFVSAGIDANIRDLTKNRDTALHYAVCFDQLEAVQCLLGLGASTNVMTSQGLSPLHQAVKYKNVEIVKLLLSAGADPMLKASTGECIGQTPVDLAKECEELMMVFQEYVIPDSGSDKSNDNDGQLMESPQSQGIILNHFQLSSPTNGFSESLQSISTPSDQSPKCFVPPSLKTPLTLVTDGKLSSLWPHPQKVVQTDRDPFVILPKHHVKIESCSPSIPLLSVIEVWNTHKDNFTRFGFELDVESVQLGAELIVGDIICIVNNQLFSRYDEYKIVVDTLRISLYSSDLVGLHYALCTLGQLVQLYSSEKTLPTLLIHDWPHLQNRGLLLDFSFEARKPKIETMKNHIRTMSFLKVNQLHCYFRLEENPEQSFPYISKELIDLSKYCDQHFISLVPCVDVISVFPSFKAIVSSAIRSLTSIFNAKCVHVGPNLSRILLKEVSTSQSSKVIWETLLLEQHHLFYVSCDSSESSDWLKFLPLNCTLLDYLCNTDEHFDANLKFLAHSGYDTCVAVTTHLCGSIAGSPEAVVLALHRAATAAVTQGARGLLLVDLQQVEPLHPPLCFVWPALLAAAGATWNSAVHQGFFASEQIPLLSKYVFAEADAALCGLVVDVGGLEQYFERMAVHGVLGTTVLHRLLVQPDAVQFDNMPLHLLREELRNIKKMETDLQKMNPRLEDLQLMLELKLIMNLQYFACLLGKLLYTAGLNPNPTSCGLNVINIGVSNLPPIVRTDLANRLLMLVEQYRETWQMEYLSSGLQHQLASFVSLLAKLIPASEQSLIVGDSGLNLLQGLVEDINISAPS